MAVGVYLSVPFCRTKCSYCNFASDVFSKSAYEGYVVRLLEEVAEARARSGGLGIAWDEAADSIYLGGGTPSVLGGGQLRRMFAGLRACFAVSADAEVTVECAPGTLSAELIETLQECGVNRVSLGVQSFVDEEARAVGRLHTRRTVLAEIERLRGAGIGNINVDLIAGLPHQTAQSWAESVSDTIASGVPHASVYMLEVDEDSRLGREVIAGGARYHAHFVPDEDASADFYQEACDRLNGAGLAQYEISNFARPGAESRHNLKYWTRQPYLGFGVDAHSMLPLVDSRLPRAQAVAIRFATADSLDGYMRGEPGLVTPVDARAAMEEKLFLGLRLNRGLERTAVGHEFEAAIEESLRDGLLEQAGTILRLSARGRLLSNEVFGRFLSEDGKQKWEPVT
jgi:oxygen-independent coproporphyrinogen-3 oxidase